MNCAKEIRHCGLVPIKLIGTGRNAKVVLARSKKQTDFAVKIISDNKLFQISLDREKEISTRLNHPNIIKTFMVHHSFNREVPKKTYFIMEYAANGNLKTHMDRCGPLPEDQAKRLFMQLTHAVDYLHNHAKVSHGDIESENVLLDQHLNLKLADFGLSKCHEDHHTADLGSTTWCGAKHSIAPEILQIKIPQTVESDVWSMGILLFYMITADIPSRNEHYVVDLCYISYINASSECKDLLKHLLWAHPNQRLTTRQILGQPWTRN